MDDQDVMRDLMARLMTAVEASLAGSASVREALDELTRNGFEARLYFVANAEVQDDAQDVDPETSGTDDPDDDLEGVRRPASAPGASPGDGTPELELTKLDRDFLRSVSIQPDGV